MKEKKKLFDNYTADSTSIGPLMNKSFTEALLNSLKPTHSSTFGPRIKKNRGNTRQYQLDPRLLSKIALGDNVAASLAGRYRAIHRRPRDQWTNTRSPLQPKCARTRCLPLCHSDSQLSYFAVGFATAAGISCFCQAGLCTYHHPRTRR